MNLAGKNTKGFFSFVLFLCVLLPALQLQAETIFQIEDFGIAMRFLRDDQNQSEYELEVTGLGNSTQTPRIETLEKPKRLVFDVPTVKRVRTFEEKLTITPGVTGVRIGGHNERLRIVFDLEDSFLPSGNIQNELHAGKTVLAFHDKSSISLNPLNSKSEQKNNSKKAYTISGDNITTRPVGDSPHFSKTPHITHEIQEHDSLPSLILEESEDIPAEAQTPPVEKSNSIVPIGNSVIETKPKVAPTSRMEIPDNIQDPLRISSIPAIEEVSKYNSFVELLVMLLVITFLAMLVLRRGELLALLGGQKEAPETEILLDSTGTSYTMPYMILGCKETDSDEKIKARYRHLVKVFHADKLQSQQLPPEVLALTDKEFQKVQQAYEQLKSMRGL